MKAKSLNIRFLLLFTFFIFGTKAWSQSEAAAKINVKSSVNQLIEEEIAQEIPVITALQLESLQKQAEVLTILDSRIKAAYDLGHLKSARHLGEDFSIEKVWMLNRTAPVVIYGDNIELSQEIGKQLLDKGFQNVSYLNGSLAA